MVKVNIRDLVNVNLDRLVYEDPEKKEGYYHSEISYLESKLTEATVEKENIENVKRNTKVKLTLDPDADESEESEESEEIEEPETSQFLVKIKSSKGHHSDIIKHDDRYYFDLYLSENDPLALFVCDVDDNNVKAIHDHSVSWFSKKQGGNKIPVDIVEQMYRSPMRLVQKKSDGHRSSYNRMRLILPTHGDSIQCEVYNQKGQLVSLSDVKSNADVSLAISLDSLWLNKKTAGCHWTVRQMKIKEEVIKLKKSKKIEGYALPSDDEDEN